MGIVRRVRDVRLPTPAPVALPLASLALLLVGATAASLHGGMTAGVVLLACCVVVGTAAWFAQPLTALPLSVIGWLTAVGFARPPYADLQPGRGRGLDAAVAIAATAAVAAGTAGLRRRMRGTLDRVSSGAGGRTLVLDLARAVDLRRQALALVLTAAVLPLLTVALTAARPDLSLADDLLIYLVVVVGVTVIGGFWPAVVAALAASLLLNWYFTPPLHTLSIAEPENLLALLLFVTVAVSVSSVVHLAARRSQQARRNSAEASSLLTLARTVLGGDDTPAAVLAHLAATLGVQATLFERASTGWVPVAHSGATVLRSGADVLVPVRRDLELAVSGDVPAHSSRLLEGYAAQAAAALDRDRLRTQAAQAEGLAEGNRMRTALLAAVSHDLRTPLASIKAGVSSLRQRDVVWSPEDQADLLATVEESSDRLDALIGNLLDMGRLQAGSLEPYLRPTALDEVAPMALRGLDGGADVRLDLPDTMPLVRADPGLLERAIANVVANALRFSPPGEPPLLAARAGRDGVHLSVVDHGPGVPAALVPSMFEPFQRLGDRDTTTGVGLGLAVARGFVEAMGGSVTATRTHGGGLTMTFVLPVAEHETDDAAHLQAGR